MDMQISTKKFTNAVKGLYTSFYNINKDIHWNTSIVRNQYLSMLKKNRT